MPRMTKSEMISEMARLGEMPPKDWTMMELSCRLDELRMEHGLTPMSEGKSKTPLRKLVIQLNEASKRKANLVEFAQKSLQVPVQGNDTILTLQRRCLLKIYEITPPSGEDPVGFGKHSSLNYHELKTTQADYAKWVITTVQENMEGQTCDPRCQRLGLWLMDQEEKAKQPPSFVKTEPIPESILIEKGYRKIKTEKGTTAPSVTSSASGSVTSSQLQATHALIQNLANVVVDLKEEVSAIKQERPRKEVKKEDEGSNGSFSVISR
eukprot:s1866_g7.t1